LPVSSNSREEKLVTSFKTSQALAAKAFAVSMFALPVAAQPGVDVNPPPAPSAATSSSDLIAHFIASAIPNANFIASASRMASVYAQNRKLRELAGGLAKGQTSVANSLTAWVNVSGPVVTRSSRYKGPAGSGTAKLSAPRLLPAQAENLQRLSTSRGSNFDSLYVATVMEALVQLQTLYREFTQAGEDPGLKAIADRELPIVEHTISTLNSL
jgi:predicted outer membrane protein